MTTMIQAAPAAPLSEAELIRLAEQPGIEYAGGRILEKTMSVSTARVEVRVARLLSEVSDVAGDAVVFSQSLNYRCFAEEPTRFRKPDVSVVRSERLAGVNPDDGFVHFPADLVIEVLSPTDLAVDVASKIEEYLANGFPLVWIVNPNACTVTIHRADGSVSLLHGQDEITGEGALPAFRCKVGAFFAGSTLTP